MISKKRFDADKNLAKNMEEKTKLEIENAHKKENVSSWSPTNNLIN